MGKVLKATYNADQRSITTDSQYVCWDSRWCHVGDGVHGWETPYGFDIMYYRTREVHDYFTRHTPFIQRILDWKVRSRLPAGTTLIRLNTSRR